ncbi:MAG TPA: YdhR family protein [Polyangiaceae bacterium]|jgi:2-polyprenyl-3-methyl-5-hydroxy-6-metoxy-1,4-benzoquinol methylase|nr:YdhR family protein [Polyangiaceae bacterium]
MTAACVQIEFVLRCTAQRYHAIAEESAARMAEVPGLRSKWWWIDAQAGRAGGVYSFESRQAAESYLAGPIVSALREASFCEGVQTRLVELLEPARSTEPSTERTPEAAATEQFAQRVLGDVSAAMTTVMVRLGHELGLYRALGEHGPLTSEELARHASVFERYAREWLHQQRAAGYLDYDRESAKFGLAPGAFGVLVAQDSPAFLPPAFDIVASMWADEARLEQAFTSGQGIGWGEHDPRLFSGCARFFGAAYASHLVEGWLPALDGVTVKLAQGATVADVGCGHGISTVLMARAFPASRFVGFDSHPPSIDAARRRAERSEFTDRVRFEQATATDYGGERYDLICFMDSFHDLGDAVAAARHAAHRLAEGGSVMLVEPLAAGRPEENHGPLAAMNYAASTALCTPNALCHHGSIALGAQAGPDALRQALAEGGLGHFRVAAKTPFHMVIEARATERRRERN